MLVPILFALTACNFVSGSLDAAVLERVCASPCNGPYASVEVYRDPDGKVGRFVYDGDLQQCSHPPRLYFDAAGQEVDAIPNRPVTSDAQAEAFAKTQSDLVAGLEKAESLRCP